MSVDGRIGERDDECAGIGRHGIGLRDEIALEDLNRRRVETIGISGNDVVLACREGVGVVVERACESRGGWDEDEGGRQGVGDDGEVEEG